MSTTGTARTPAATGGARSTGATRTAGADRGTRADHEARTTRPGRGTRPGRDAAAGRDTDIAVIGVSFELPRCSTWEELERLLDEGRHQVAPYPQERVDALGLVRTEQDAEGCWQEHLGAFDHRYFGLSRAEAELIDPRQRRMLSLAVAAIGHAGHAPKQLRGRNVAVVVAGYCGILPSLLHLLPEDEQRTGRAFAGSLPAYSAGRLAYHLDLRGPAFVVDTACSSFLVALHEARWKLARGESELALVGGYAAMLGDIPARPAAGEGMGVNSPSNRCRSFDAGADGTVIGEGGGFVLLKRLDAALRDGDTVHAVIRGSALNQDAGRSNGLTSPSPTAQAEVITAALRDADIDPATVGYVEAHGTGTRVGDPIEMKALAETYGARSRGRASLPVSTVKANVGHLDAMAGLAGLVRVIAQFRAGRIYPTAGFRTLNPLIDLTGVPLHVTAATEPWPAGEEPRRAGISGFGLSGTNAHLVVEEPPAPAPAPERPVPGERLVVLSAPTPDGLRRLAGALRESVAAGGTGLDRVADVLAAGREHFAHRLAWIARDGADLVAQIDATLAAGAQQALPKTPVVLVLGDAPVTDAQLGLLAGPPAAADVLRRAEAVLPRERWTAAQRAVVHLAAQHAVLARYGLRFDLVLAHGTGALARRVADGELGLDEAMRTAVEAAAAPERSRLEGALAAFGSGPLLVDLAPDGPLSRLLAEVRPDATAVAPGARPEELLRLLHLQGRGVDWAGGLGEGVRRAELPLAPPAEEPCWPPVRPRPAEPGPAPAEDAGTDLSDGLTVEEAVVRITGELLKEPVTPADDFFARGGDSLAGTLLVTRLNQRFGTGLEVLDLYDMPDLAALAEAVREALAESGSGVAPAAAPSPASAPAPGPDAAGAAVAPSPGMELPGMELPGMELSGQQAAIWTAVTLDPGSDAYSVPAAFLVRGELDEQRLEAALDRLVARHDMLRCTLEDTEYGPRQYVAAPVPGGARLIRETWDFGDLTAADGHLALLARLGGLVAEPFRPYEEPSRRFHLVRARFRDGERTVLVLNFHHLFFDGWSWELVLADLGADGPSPAPGRGYRDFVRDQATALDGDRGEVLRRFWADYLDGAEPGSLPADLPVDLPGGAPAAAGADLALPVTGAGAAALRDLCATERISLNMLFLAAWGALLWRISGTTDLCVAMPVANRPPGHEAVVGCYTNTVLVRVRVDPDGTFGDLLAQVRESSLQAIGHGDFPTDRILRTARHPSGRPLAATMLGLQSGGEPRAPGEGAPVLEPLDVRQAGAQFPLELTVLNGPEDFGLVLKYATGTFAPGTAGAWLEEFGELLGRIAREGRGLALGTLARPAAEPPPPRPAALELPDFDF
ncbi:condensation domain-containing protein [Kitasatospora purpeofusca]|uniref:condensation domain-containing protein n=1 Tax=Kitasatospora purpeofusca TaxID=67352 RepID=UPI0036AABD3E